MIRHRIFKSLGFAPRYLAATNRCPELAAVANAIACSRQFDGWQVLSSSAQTRVAKGEWNGRPVFLKLFIPRSRSEPVKALVRGSRGVRAVDQSIRMNESGFATPTSLCHGWIRGSIEYVATDALPHPTVNDLATHEGGAIALGTRERWQLLNQVGAEIARLHTAGWIHGDLRLGNILCEWHGPDGAPKFWYLDNEGNRRSRRTSDRMRNLVQLLMTPRNLLSRFDQYRLLQGYAKAQKLSREQSRTLARAVEHARARRWKRRLARGGPKARYSSQASD